jgi:hypothetical protein
MSEENQNNDSSSQPPYAPAEETVIYEPLSKTDAMAGVITEPGETYEAVTAAKNTNYWLTPMLIVVVSGLIAAFLFMSNAELIESVMRKERVKLQEQMDKQVQDGKMTREQADKSIEQAEKFMNPSSPFFMVLGYGGALIGPFVILFVLSLLYMVFLKMLKAEFEFTSILNVVGLAMIISAIGTILSTVLSVVMGEVATISPGLLISEDSAGPFMHKFISSFDVFTIWFYMVVAIGLSKIGRTSVMKPAVFVFGIWLLWTVVTTLVVPAVF